MKTLIQLELERTNMKKYWYGCLGIFLSVLAIGGMMLLIPFVGQIQGEVIEMNDYELFLDPNMRIMLYSILNMACYAVLSSVMFARILVEEYVGKRAILLFTYPVKRSRILWAKCLLILSFTAVMGFISNIITIGLLELIATGIHHDSIYQSSNALLNLVCLSVLMGFLSAAVGLVAMRIGFWKKSLVVTIVAAVIFCSVFSNLFQLFISSPLPVILAAVVILLLLGMLLFLSLVKRIKQMEAL